MPNPPAMNEEPTGVYVDVYAALKEILDYSTEDCNPLIVKYEGGAIYIGNGEYGFGFTPDGMTPYGG